MPGISLISSSENLMQKKQLIENTLSSLNILNGYKSQTILLTKRMFLGLNKYEKYPIETIYFNQFTIIVEGKIYNKVFETLQVELIELAKKINQKNITEELKTWLLTCDGDFIIYFIDNKLDKIYIINDVFGRLPLYYSVFEQNIIVSRYLKFISELSENKNFDKMAIAQFLLLGYMVGKKTLFENVYHVRPASFIKIENTKFEVVTIHEFNFDIRENKERSLEQNVSELIKLFDYSCINRANGFSENIVTLSGGLDSRLVASCMSKNKIPYSIATIDYESGKAQEEIEVALKLSEIFNIPTKVVLTSIPTGTDLIQLLKTKEGMVSLATAPILPFYKGIIESYGDNIQYVSGDNGDKVIFTYDKPIKKKSSISSLVKSFIDEYSLVNINLVSKITSVAKEDILKEFESIFKAFPEKSIVQKYIHFKAIEKPFKSAFNGEDRHRHFFWNSSPFWSYPFFNYIMGIPESSKIRHKLFRELLLSYSIEATNLPYTNFKSSINSIKGKSLMLMFFYFYHLLPYNFIKKIKSFFFGGSSKHNIDHIANKCILEQMKNVTEMKYYFNFDELIPFLSNISNTNLYNILSITSSIEWFLTNSSEIEKRIDNEFN